MRCCPRLTALALVLAAGCGKSDMPRVYPVTGSVAFKDGRPLPGGAVQFKSLTDPSLTVAGNVKQDGTFTLLTLRDKEKVPGAPEGSYTVTVLPPIGEDHRPLMPPVELPRPYQVEAKEDNRFDIRIDRPTPAAP